MLFPLALWHRGRSQAPPWMQGGPEHSRNCGITVYFCLGGLFTATAPVCSCQGAEETKALGPVCKQSTKGKITAGTGTGQVGEGEFHSTLENCASEFEKRF